MNMRLFISVNMAEPVRSSLAGVQNRLKKSGADVKWVEEQNLHLTLKFLGDTDAGRLGLIQERLKAAVAGINSFDIRFEGTDFFPDAENPRVIWIGISKGADELSALALSIDESLAYAGFQREAKKFVPHLTIGRFRTRRNFFKLKESIQLLALPCISQPVNSIFLVQSSLTPSGSVYNNAGVFQLSGSSSGG
jgi:2'-5' RNA ligase